MNKKAYRKELRSILARVDELTAENRRITDSRSRIMTENTRLSSKVSILEMEINNTETTLTSAERAIRYHEAKFDAAAEFTGKLIRYSNET